MVKFTRCDFAFMLYILISSFCEIIEYLCKFDGNTGILIIVFLLFLIPVFLGYAIFFLLEIINLIKSKSFDSVSAIFFYIACFLPILIFPNYPEWIHSNWALLVLLVRILVLNDYLCQMCYTCNLYKIYMIL